MLAGELALAGVDVVIVERRADQSVDGSRAGGLHTRTIEVLDQRGIAERFISAGKIHPALFFGGVMFDLTDFPTRHPYLLALWQSEFEPILADWVAELGVPTIRSCEVVGLAQDDDGVDVELSDRRTLRTAYLVGCDGGRSLVRKAAGIEFPGLAASTSFIIAEVEMDGEPEVGVRKEGGGLGPVDPATGGNPYRAVLAEREVEHDREPTLDDLREALVHVYGSDFGLRSASWISRFTDASRQAAAYRSGRVLVAGDAAHVHPPQGGQGLNVGVQDAVNLGWKLALVVQGIAPDALLDTYHAERHPVGARVQHNTQAQVALQTGDERHQSLRELVADLLGTDEARRRIAAMVSGLDVHYDLGEGHPLLGRRMPDLDLQTADGTIRAYELLHDAKGLLLNLAGPAAMDAVPWADRVQVVDATTDGPWELPVLGEVPAPSAVLVRPDGHVAWTGSPGEGGLEHALSTWFGRGEA
jgi:3-(3-hydroxy-phenyl)propionate hydroxylase